MKKVVLWILIMSSACSMAQDSLPQFKAHQNLVGGVWEADARWQDGSPFKVQITYEPGLRGKILKTKTNGNINYETDEFGLRNEGIRYFDTAENQLRFYEWDVFGGLSQGEVVYIGPNIYYYYTYKHDGQSIPMTDGWEYLNKDTYAFKVGYFDADSNKWTQIYLSTEMKRSQLD